MSKAKNTISEQDIKDYLMYLESENSNLPQMGWGGALSGMGAGAATGAAVGSVIPIWGTAVGAVAGAIGGGIAGHFKEEKADELQTLQRNQMSMATNQRNFNNMNKNNQLGYFRTPTMMAFGGQNPVVQEYSGQTHEGPNQGIPIDGMSNPSQITGGKATSIVEDGEVSWNNYVFSNRLKDDNGKTFAEVAKSKMSKYKRRLGDKFDVDDSMAQESMDKELFALMQKNEASKISNGIKVAQKLWAGDFNNQDIPTQDPKIKGDNNFDTMGLMKGLSSVSSGIGNYILDMKSLDQQANNLAYQGPRLQQSGQNFLSLGGPNDEEEKSMPITLNSNYPTTNIKQTNLALPFKVIDGSVGQAAQEFMNVLDYGWKGITGLTGLGELDFANKYLGVPSYKDYTKDVTGALLKATPGTAENIRSMEQSYVDPNVPITEAAFSLMAGYGINSMIGQAASKIPSLRLKLSGAKNNVEIAKIIESESDNIAKAGFDVNTMNKEILQLEQNRIGSKNQLPASTQGTNVYNMNGQIVGDGFTATNTVTPKVPMRYKPPTSVTKYESRIPNIFEKQNTKQITAVEKYTGVPYAEEVPAIPRYYNPYFGKGAYPVHLPVSNKTDEQTIIPINQNQQTSTTPEIKLDPIFKEDKKAGDYTNDIQIDVPITYNEQYGATTYKSPETKEDKKKFNTDYLNLLPGLANTLYGAIDKPYQYNPEDFVAKTKIEPVIYRGDEARKNIQSQIANTSRALRGQSPTMQMASMIAADTAGNQAMGQLGEQVFNINEQYRMQAQNQNLGAEVANMRTKLMVETMNEQNRAARANMITTGVGQMFNAMQGISSTKATKEAIDKMYPQTNVSGVGTNITATIETPPYNYNQNIKPMNKNLDKNSEKIDITKSNKDVVVTLDDRMSDYMRYEGSNIISNGKHLQYKDPMGNTTIGYGHLVTEKEAKSGIYNNGLSEQEARNLLNKDIKLHSTELYRDYPWIKEQPESVRIALEDMYFNMGGTTFSDFKETQKLIRNGNYEQAARNIENTPYYKQTGRRAKENVARIRSAIQDMALNSN
jgi:lysozyme